MLLLYVAAITPLQQIIKLDEAHEVRQAAFVNHLNGAGKLAQLHDWWVNILIYGPRLGYFPRADKSWLIFKPNREQSAKEIFTGTDVCITTDGHEYLGGYIGTNEGQSNYTRNLVRKWADQILLLSEIARFNLK